VAARCHALRRARRLDRPLVALGGAPSTTPAELTDAEWELVRPLLPPRRPPTGRPRHGHRALLSGIVWVVRTRASWRDMPLEFGKWETAYKRYRLWNRTGLWQRLLAVLGDDALKDSGQVSL